MSLVAWITVAAGPLGELLGQEPLTVSIPKIVPPEVPGGRQEIPLPETVDEIDVGGGGRYLALHFKALHKIGIFDVNQLKIAGYVSAADADTKFAAGATKMIVVSGDSGVMARWDLATQERELTQTIDLRGPAGHALLGAMSAGPAIISGGGKASVVDMNTLQVTPFASSNMRRGFDTRANIRISADGSVLGVWESGVSPSGLQSYVNLGDTWTGYYEHDSVGAIVPSPDGRLLYTGRGIFTNQLRRIGDVKSNTSLGSSIPAVHGPYFVTVDSGDIRDREKKAEKVYLKLEGDDRPLADIPNLEQIHNPEDRFARQTLSLDKRLFLIPDAGVVVQLASTKQKLVVVSFDVDKALKESDVDYLIVASRPPLAVKAGEPIEYQIDVKSKSGGVKYSLDAGPAGMTISPTGLLTWNTTAESAAKSNVIVSVADDSGQQVFHTFDLTVHGGDASASGVDAVAVSSTGEAPKALPTTPADLKSDATEVKLPGTAADVAVGGAGRFLFFHLRELKRIAVLDVSQGKIAGYLPASDDDTKIVAGATRALVFSLSQGVVTRYRLDTLQRELSVAIPFSDPIQYVGMGGGSEGPVMLRTSKGTGQIDSSSFHFMDLETMKPITVSWPNGRQPHAVFRDRNQIDVSTNGNTFVVSGVGVVRVDGDSVRMAGGRSEYGGLPSPDGRFFLAGGRLLNSDLQAVGDAQTSYGTAIPSVTGSYFLGLTNTSSIPTRTPTTTQSAKLYMFGDNRPLVTIQDLKVTVSAYPYGASLPLQKRLFFVPDAHVIATLLPSNDRVELRRFNVDEALEASGVDYLLVASQAPSQAEIGKPYTYPMQVKSKRGGVKFSLEAAPAGMKISEDGEITWTPPDDVDQEDYKVIVSVSDASGQSTFHTFSVGLPEVAQRRAAEQRQREEQARLAQAEAQRKRLEERQKAQAAQMAALEQSRKRAEEAAAKRAAESEKFRASIRTWTDSTGQHTIVARFVEIVDKNTVVLELQDGQNRSVPLSKLSDEDIYEAVKSDLMRQGAVPPKDAADSPFKP
ncbi:MAG: putative Ig domain-containing protein [Pirellulaceae bacterium]